MLKNSIKRSICIAAVLLMPLSTQAAVQSKDFEKLQHSNVFPLPNAPSTAKYTFVQTSNSMEVSAHKIILKEIESNTMWVMDSKSSRAHPSLLFTGQISNETYMHAIWGSENTEFNKCNPIAIINGYTNKKPFSSKILLTKASYSKANHTLTYDIIESKVLRGEAPPGSRFTLSLSNILIISPACN